MRAWYNSKKRPGTGLSHVFWKGNDRMKRVLACVMVFVLLASCALAEQPELEDELARIFKAYKTAGATLCVAKDGEIVYEYNYGYAHKKSKEPVSEETYFRIASVTKLISGIHVMQLVEQGLLTLDDSIGDYLGYPVYNLYYPKVPVTLRHLMTHTSSLSSKGGYTRESNTLSDLIDARNKKRGNWYREEPGSAYRYSNFGAGIMGSLIEAVTGKNLNDSVTEGLFAPLNIDAAYHPTLLNEPEKIASLYATSGSSRARSMLLRDVWDASVNPDKHYRLTVGAVWIHGRDLCRIGMMMANGGTLDGTVILQPETVAAMLSDQNGQGYVTCDTPYGLSVNRVDNLLEGRMLYGHQGLTDSGTVCNLYWDPETQFVFALITNGSSTKMEDHIAKVSRRTFALMWENFSGE